VTVFNLLGQKVATLWDGILSSGTHRLRWDGNSSASGVYFLRVEAGTQVATRRMVLLK
jgi:hypothetical protein